jgi:Probable zinc-ribbon domain
MTSDKSKAERLKQSQLLKAKEHFGIDTTAPNVEPPPGAVLADQNELSHNNTYGRLPRFYVDKLVVCHHCGTEEVWAADRQKWWYEVAKRNINTDAVLCRACRDKEKQRKEEARSVHIEGLKKKREKIET